MQIYEHFNENKQINKLTNKSTNIPINKFRNKLTIYEFYHKNTIKFVNLQIFEQTKKTTNILLKTQTNLKKLKNICKYLQIN